MDLQRRWIKLKKEIKKATTDLEENLKNIREIVDVEYESKNSIKNKKDRQN